MRHTLRMSRTSLITSTCSIRKLTLKLEMEPSSTCKTTSRRKTRSSRKIRDTSTIKVWHLAFFEGGSGGSGYRLRDLSKDDCYNCNQKGHHAKNCLKLSKSKKKEIGQDHVNILT